MTNYLFKNGTLVTLDPPAIVEADLRVAGGKIAARGANLKPAGDETVTDLTGKILMPGLVCAHSHLYSMLARGMPAPKRAPKNFPEILQSVWWKLDRALDEEAIYYSALVGGIEAVLAGTTTIIDHHASPCFIKGSLNVICKALERVGIRAVLCYEVTDRGGLAECERGLEENREFASAARGAYFRGLVGAHASFTLSEASLRACGELASKLGTGVHIHVAEDVCDAQDAQSKYGKSVAARLLEAGILTPRSVLAHGTHLSASDAQKIRAHKSWLIHNPQSNMNNAVGYAPVADFGARAALGTDGISMDMFAETRAAFFKSQDAGGGLAPLDCLRFLSGGHRLAAELFEQPLGGLGEGAAADLVILNYPLPTPLTNDNLPGHFIFGMTSAHVESVLVGGKFVVKDRMIGHLELGALYKEAQKIAQRLWSRI